MGRFAQNLTAINHGAIGQVRPWHRALARAVVAGRRPMELAEMYGYTLAHISRILASPLFKAHVAMLESQTELSAVGIRDELVAMAPRANEILDRELELDPISLNERKLQVDIAKDILDRVGHSKQSAPSIHLHKHEHRVVKEMTDEELYRDVIEMAQEEGGE